MYTTIAEIRKAFWEAHPEFKSEYRSKKHQNDYNPTIRTAFVDWLDSMRRDGTISDRHAKNATL